MSNGGDNLPSSGREREIFLRALRFYSDACESPGLHEDCPFSFDAPGGRACDEECMDMLSLYGVKEQGRISLAEGVVVSRIRRRSKTRRPPDAVTWPFDAKQFHLADKEKSDIEHWRFSSLLMELRSLLTTPPQLVSASRDERVEQASDIWSELEDRGLCVDAFIREALSPHIGLGIAMSLVLPVLMRKVRPDIEDEVLRSVEAPEGWMQLIETEKATANVRVDSNDADVDAWASRVVTQLAPKAASWAAQAAREDLLDWRAPTESEFKLLAPIDPGSLHGPHRWIADRFMTTYFEDWHGESLRFEWRYLHGEVVAPCNSAVMKERRVDSSELGRTIANLAVNDRLTTATGTKRFSTADCAAAGLGFLREGRRAAAVALYEGIRQVASEDPEACNNFGFCLLPDDPRTALAALEEADRRGYTPRAINAGNRMLCLFLLGRHSSALSVAECLVDEWDRTPPSPGYMWDFGGEGILTLIPDARNYVLDLAVHIAEAIADVSAIQDWRSKREALSA